MSVAVLSYKLWARAPLRFSAQPLHMDRGKTGRRHVRLSLDVRIHKERAVKSLTKYATVCADPCFAGAPPARSFRAQRYRSRLMALGVFSHIRERTSIRTCAEVKMRRRSYLDWYTSGRRLRCVYHPSAATMERVVAQVVAGAVH